MKYQKALMLFCCALLIGGTGIFVGCSLGNRHPSGSSNARTTPSVSPTRATMPTPSPAPTFATLNVRGTQILNARGQAITLVGATHSSLEYRCAGDGHFQPTDFQAMRSWGMNVVRFTLSSEFWANAGNDCPDYHTIVTAAVTNARAAGLYVILDLQWNAPLQLSSDPGIGGGQYPLPDSVQDVSFWQNLAQLYHTDTGVLFDLFGEPYGVSWDVWFNGGQITTQAIQGNHFVGGQGSYQAIGMNELVAKVRAVAPDNIIILGGLSWGYDLTGIDQQHRIQASNILYSTHPFDYEGKQPSNWAHDFGNLAQSLPVIVGEFGSYSCQTGYISAAISYFNKLHLSWLAWEWVPGSCSGPSLLADWSGTPSTPYGAYIRQQVDTLACAQGDCP